MTAAVLLRGPHTTPSARYGAAEIKASAERNMSLAAFLAAGLVCLFTLTATVMQRVLPRAPVDHAAGHTGVTMYDFLIPLPPTLTHPARPASGGAPAGHVADGIQVVVPDASHVATGDLPETGARVLVGPGPDAGTGPSGPGPGPVTVQPHAEPGEPRWIPRDTEPELLTSPPPAYPELARENRIEGQVVLWAWVGVDGRVGEVRVAQGVPVLNDAAVQAVKRWTFKPALGNGRPVGVWVAVPIRFALAG